MCSLEPNCPFPPDAASLHITRDAEIPCLPHCWWFLSVLCGNCGCQMSGAEVVTMSLTLSHKAQLSVWSNIPWKAGLIMFSKIRGQLFFLAVRYLPLPPLNTALCTMCPAHTRSWECDHMLTCTYPSVYLLSTASVWSKGKGCLPCLLLVYQGQILLWKAAGSILPQAHLMLFANTGFHSRVSYS